MARRFFIYSFCALVSISAWSAGGTETDGKQYRHKYLFTQKKQTTTNCIRIVATAMKALSSYKSCKAWKGSSLGLEAAVAKCEKADGTLAFVFETFDECTNAKDETDENHAT